MTVTLDQMRNAQRTAPQSPETGELQRAWERQRRDEQRTRDAAVYLAREKDRQVKDGPKRRGDAGDPVRVWRQCRSCGAIPAVGDKTIIFPDELVTYDGESVGSFATGYQVEATAVQIGAHWSDQPHGAAGWYVLYEFARPAGAEMIEFC